MIDGCILGRGVHILDHVHLTHGTMVGDGCVIGPDVSLPAFSRVSMHGYRACEDDSDTEAADTDADTTLGKASRGCLDSSHMAFIACHTLRLRRVLECHIRNLKHLDWKRMLFVLTNRLENAWEKRRTHDLVLRRFGVL